MINLDKKYLGKSILVFVKTVQKVFFKIQDKILYCISIQILPRRSILHILRHNLQDTVHHWLLLIYSD